MRTSRSASSLLSLVLLLAAYGLLRFPKEVSQAVRDGLALCFDTLLPTLFPFFILSALVVKTGLSNTVGRRLSPIMRPVFHLPGACAAALMLGLIGGYPTGARTVTALYTSGQCSRSEAERMSGFCCTCSPAFLLGTVGSGMFGSIRCGILLVGVHWCSAVTTGFLMSRSSDFEQRKRTQQQENAAVISLPCAFSDSVKESFHALLDLFAFVLCFAAVSSLLELTKIPVLLAGQLLPSLTGNNAKALLLGLLDMPRCVTLVTDGTLSERLVLCSLLLAWGGVSIHCQILSILTAGGLSVGSYLKGKFLHALLSALMMSALCFRSNALCLLFGCVCLISPCFLSKKSSGKTKENPL